MQGKHDLSVEELQHIQQCLDAEETAVEKCKAFAKQTEDPELREICQNISKTHNEHYNSLLKYLQQHERLNQGVK
ncbi:MAG: hypothetical protein FH749_15545 [Firmicutes bacterium]|nr:hypothetical protein [Bacillota bacterium]